MERRSLSFVAADALETIPPAMRRAEATSVLASLDDLPGALEVAAARHRDLIAGRAVDLDLIGHSTRGHHLLRIGAIAIDLLDLGIRRWFEQLTASGLVRAANATSLRLLGCQTAATPSGQRTLRLLAAILELPVSGTRKSLNRLHYSAHGFVPGFRGLLVESRPPRDRVRSGLLGRAGLRAP